MRTFLIAGNWKMNGKPSEAVELAKAMVSKWEGKTLKSEPLICPPFISVPAVAEAFKGSSFKTGAQNVHTEESGAFTGETSAAMLKDAGCTYVLAGHSERRELFHEDNELVAAKTKKAIESGLTAILCVGEKLEERKNNTHESVVADQVNSVLNILTEKNAGQLVIAYEPVWAIGTGETATPQQAQDMHAFIRGLVSEKWGENAGSSIRILYGGSMKPENAEELLSQPDVDGGLIGGASLKADSFNEIISIAESI
ncbi:MAG TPA: triose-phosphate isomerase [Balneolaceae bacterium]|nr:triose-phosphate isomerase [Balneolaceae bacterium]